MTDWRQIQARIRKAKNSPDALSKLSELFQRTRDGMVAWELGAIEEKSEHTGEAVKWYTVAVERFRRAEWKKKAEEALVRLGAPVPTGGTSSVITDPPDMQAAPDQSQDDPPASGDDPPSPSDHEEEEDDSQLAMMPRLVSAENRGLASGGVGSTGTPPVPAQNSPSANGDPKRKRRRGRRGGRGRRRREGASAPSLPNQAFAESVESQSRTAPSPSLVSKAEFPAPVPFRQPEPKPSPAERAHSNEPSAHEPTRSAPVEMPAPAPQLPSQRTAHGRSGDPALASRMAHLESILRRLLASTLHRLDDIEHAPAGPGVFLLSDSDQTTSYYIESCQTLRVGLGNLLRGGRGGKGSRGGAGAHHSESGLKAKLAEHLGINEAKVGQYMKDHCVVRWIQLDDEAAHLAHFAIGVLRTPCNLE